MASAKFPDSDSFFANEVESERERIGATCCGMRDLFRTTPCSGPGGPVSFAGGLRRFLQLFLFALASHDADHVRRKTFFAIHAVVPADAGEPGT
jgi:hypothetical protein